MDFYKKLNNTNEDSSRPTWKGTMGQWNNRNRFCEEPTKLGIICHLLEYTIVILHVTIP